MSSTFVYCYHSFTFITFSLIMVITVTGSLCNTISYIYLVNVTKLII
jgi:hypothetical protein